MDNKTAKFSIGIKQRAGSSNIQSIVQSLFVCFFNPERIYELENMVSNTEQF